ncbi:MAG: class I SAM-dependent methyltransferase [Actinomycetota bacterium]|nr:class I SAM-dependent methyltransferase [Actinomycetota bacterium]
MRAFRRSSKTARAPENSAAELVAARDWYSDQIALGVQRFLEPPRATCPWCSSGRIARYLTSKDIRQAKPGTFTLDRCSNCRHIFQNPRLTIDGLDFYYRDAYDGLNAAKAEANFASLSAVYLRRASSLRDARPDTPLRWLDVGTGNGRFCAVASELFPKTRFDGLDLASGVVEAQERGWVHTAHRGLLLDLQDRIVGQYDQVSMHHYLEHTREPLAELDAAVRALTSDGWLMIEQPDPDCTMAKALRSWWAGWLQPEHQHMVNLDNLLAALEERGLEIVRVQHSEAHLPLEAFLWLTTLLRTIAPDPTLPWRPARYVHLARVRRLFGIALIAPLIPLAGLIDRFVIPRALHSAHAYRVIARRVQA